MGILGEALKVMGLDDDQKPEQYKIDIFTPQQWQLHKQAGDIVGKGLKRGVSPYPGTQVPSTGPLLSRYLEMAGGYQPTTGPLYQGGGSLLQRVLSGQPAAPQVDTTATKQYWTDKYFNPMMSTFKYDVLPQLKETYTAGVGAKDTSGLHRASTRELGRMYTDLSSQYADLLWGERMLGETALDRALSAVPLAAGYETTPYLSTMDVLSQAGGIGRELEREPLQEDYQKWLTQQPYMSPYLSMASPMLYQSPYQPYLYQPPLSFEQQLMLTLAAGGAQGAGMAMGGGMA
jgi:hypothetical protein